MKEIIPLLKTINSAGRVIETGEDGFACKVNDLMIIFSWGLGWEHTSVHSEKGIPSWQEMCFIKDLFWNDSETVIQYHPARSDYVNIHPHVLHLWRPTDVEIPMPPKEFV